MELRFLLKLNFTVAGTLDSYFLLVNSSEIQVSDKSGNLNQQAALFRLFICLTMTIFSGSCTILSKLA